MIRCIEYYQLTMPTCDYTATTGKLRKYIPSQRPADEAHDTGGEKVWAKTTLAPLKSAPTTGQQQPQAICDQGDESYQCPPPDVRQ